MPHYKLLTKEEVEKIHTNAHKEYLEQGMFILSCVAPELARIKNKDLVIEELAKLYRLSQRYSFDIHSKYFKLKEIFSLQDSLPALQNYIIELSIQADTYKEILSNTIRRGIQLRRQINPQYPELFNNGSTHYFEIEPIMTQKQILQKVETDFRKAIPYRNQFSAQLADNTFTYKNQTYRAGRFLFQRCNSINSLKHEIEENPIYIAAYQSFFENSNYESFKAYRSLEKKRKEQFYGLRSELDFYLFCSYYKKNQENNYLDKIKKTILEISQAYVSLLKDFQFTSDHYLEHAKSIDLKETEDITKFSIDLIILSNHPNLIARKSTYVWWQNHVGSDGEMTETCMAADGENHATYVPRSIGSGSLIAIGVNKCCPDRWLSRIDIEPYLNKETNEVLYQPGRLYGQPSIGFYQYVKAFCHSFNKGKEGVFKLRKGLYRDNGLPIYWEKIGKEERSYS